MKNVLRKVKKLRGRGLRELSGRAAQALAARAERAGLSKAARVPADAELFALLDSTRVGAGPSAESLLENFRAHASRRFFPSFQDPAGTAAELSRLLDADERRLLLLRAERVVQGRFDLLGLIDLWFGQPIDWRLNPVSNTRTPLSHWSRIDYLDPRVAGDKKIVWELNRHQHFFLTGRAYWLTNDERYAAAFAEHLASWMDANPPKRGINWASSLEVAFRAISWLWALHLFKDSPHLSPALHLRALKFLYLHARHVETYLSTYFSPNTHLTGEALGLFYLGTLLPEFRDAERWRATGRRILLEQLPLHVRPDGVYFEQSSYYHRYTADFYTHFLLLARAAGEPVDAEVSPRLTALLDHLMHITRPDGTSPFYGDDDGGRLALLDASEANDFRPTLATGASIFGRADYKYVAGAASETTLWLAGAEGLRAFERLAAAPPAETSRAFREGGFYCVRDSWDGDASHILIDCGPHGSERAGHVHAHADALSFEMSARGRTLLVDPGTYTYTGSARERDYFRSTAAHNTLVIDGQSSSSSDGPFAWRHVARARALRWHADERFSYFEGTHDGYQRLKDAPATHVRSVLFLRRDYALMRDRVETEGRHRYELFFHFAPGAEPVLENQADERSAVLREPGEPGLSLQVFGGGGVWEMKEGWVSPCYGSRVPAPIGVYSCEGVGAQEFYTLLIPRASAAEGWPRAREVEAEGGRAFEVIGEAARDLLLVAAVGARDGERASVHAAGCESDFEWAWLRFDGEGSVPSEWVVVGGSRLACGGHELFPAGAGRVGFAAGGEKEVAETRGAPVSTKERPARETAGAGRSREEVYVRD
jgi:hypothetical protein